MFILQNVEVWFSFKATAFQYEIAHYVYGASRSCVLIYNVRNQIQTYMVIACSRTSTIHITKQYFVILVAKDEFWNQKKQDFNEISNEIARGQGLAEMCGRFRLRKPKRILNRF
jgi:hypothetical protein